MSTHRIISWALVTAWAALGACSFDAHRQELRCRSDDGCGAGLVCVSGLCAAAAAGDALVGQIGDGLPADRALPRLDAAPDDGPAEDLAPPPDDLAQPEDLGLDLAPPPDPPDLAPLDLGAPGLPLPEREAIDERLCPQLDRRCIPVTVDGHLDEDDDDDEVLRDPELKVRERHRRRRWVILRFDLDRLQGRRQPLSCELVLRRAESSRQHTVPTLLLQRVAPWPALVTWERRPSATDDPPVEIRGLPAAGTAFALDVSGFMRRASLQGAQYLALLIRVATVSYGEVEFDSLEAGSPNALPPYLDCLFPADP